MLISKSNNNNFTKAVKIYILSIVISLLASPLIGKLYLVLYKPNLIISGLYIINEPKLEIYLGGFIVAYFIFLSFFVFYLAQRKQWSIWVIGIIIPLLLSILNGLKYIFWALILSALGWGLAQLILIIKKRHTK